MTPTDGILDQVILCKVKSFNHFSLKLAPFAFNLDLYDWTFKKAVLR